MAAGRDMTSSESASMFVAVGNNLQMTESAIGVATIGNSVQVNGGTIGLLNAGGEVRLEENSKVLMTTRQALACGAAFGVIFGLLNLIFRRKK